MAKLASAVDVTHALHANVHGAGRCRRSGHVGGHAHEVAARHVEQQRPLRERVAARHGVAGAGAPGRDVQRRLDEAAQPSQLNDALAGDLVLRLVDGRDLADRVCMGTTGTRT